MPIAWKNSRTSSGVGAAPALTASASREKHFVALDSLATLLGVTITHSHLVQRSPGDVIHGEPVTGLLVDGNVLECLGPTADTFSAVAVRAVVAPIDDVKVQHNSLSGNCRYLLRASSTASFGVRTTIVGGNLTRAAAVGVYYENAAPLEVPIIDGNAFRGILSTSSYVVGAGAAGYVGSN